MKKQIFIVSVAVFVLFTGTALAIENNWHPTPPQGWIAMSQIYPQTVSGCSGDLSIAPDYLKKLCEGSGNRTWAFFYTNFSKFDPKTGKAPSVGVTLYHDFSANKYYLYCGPKFYTGYDPTAGFREVDEGSVNGAAAACFK